MGWEAFRERVKIYATDVDEEALAQARLASYSAKEVEMLSAASGWSATSTWSTVATCSAATCAAR